MADPTEIEVADPTEIEVADPTEIEVADPTEIEVAGPTEIEVAGPTDTEVAGPTEIEVAGPTEIEVADPTEIEVAGPTNCLTQPLRGAAWPTSCSTDLITHLASGRVPASVPVWKRQRQCGALNRELLQAPHKVSDIRSSRVTPVCEYFHISVVHPMQDVVLHQRLPLFLSNTFLFQAVPSFAAPS